MMQSLAVGGPIDFTGTSPKRAGVQHRPRDGGGVFPSVMSTATVQYGMRQAPTRGMAELLASYRTNPWLQKCLRVIARKQAEVSWGVFVRPSVNTGKRESLRKYLRRKGQSRYKSVSKALATGELKELDNHPLLDLWENPNPIFGGMVLRMLWASYLELQGECFTYKRRDSNGIVYELWPIPPTWVYRVPTSSEPFFDLSVMGRSQRISADDIMWFKHPELLDPYARGAGVGESLGSYIDTDEYAMQFQKAFFYNNARPNLMMFLPGADEDTVLDFQNKLEDATRGSLRAHRPLIYQAAQKIEVTEFDTGKGMEAAIPLLEHDRDTFVSVFGVPPELMGILSNSNRATIEVAETIMARNVTAPACELLMDELARDLVFEFDQGEGKILFMYENPVPDDADFQLQVITKTPWIASANELRKLAGLPDKGKDGEYYMVPQLYTATDDPAVPIEKPMPTGFGAPSGNAPMHAPNDAPAEKKKPKIRDYYAEISKGISKADDPPSYHRVTDTRTKRVIAAIQPKAIDMKLSPEWEAKMQEVGQQAVDEFAPNMAFDVYNENIKTHLEDFSSDRITWVNDTTRDAVAKALGEGVDKGEGYIDLAKRVEDVFADAKGYRAQLIARTEVIRSSNYASLQGFKQTGIVTHKRWIGTLDDRIRDTHAELTEQDPIPIDEPFVINGMEGDAPGDFDDPAEVCNCRCALAPVAPLPGDDELRPEDIADEQGMLDEDDGEKRTRGIQKSMSDEVRWKRFDKGALDWEKSAIALLHKAFDEQQKAALAALR